MLFNQGKISRWIRKKCELIVRQCQNRFAKFKSANCDAEDAPRFGRPVKADKNSIKVQIDAN